jgi:cytochrome P450
MTPLPTPQTDKLLRPPAPVPRAGPLRFVDLLKALRTNPLEAWSETHFQEPVVVSRLMGLCEIAIISDPKAIRHVLTQNAGNYRKDSVQKRMLSMLANGLLTAEGEQWQRQRRMLAPIFTPQSVRTFASPMVEAVSSMIANWRGTGDGTVRDVAAEVTLLTLDVLQRTIFSDGLGRDSAEVRAAMRTYLDGVGRIDPLDLLGVPDFVPRLGRRGTRSAGRVFEQAVDTMIANRRQRLADNANSAPRDLLTLLLEARGLASGRHISEAELRANIITLMAAGHETTANAITWSLYLLSACPAWRERVVKEAETAIPGPAPELPSRLVETRAVVEEAMRLYPPLAAISRVAIGPDRFAGVSIRPGTMIVIAPYVLHRHRSLWEEPNAFDPNRFIGERRGRIDRYAYLPFGAGPRACLGSVFALQEAVVAVAAVTRDFELSVAPGHIVWPVHRVTLRPRDGLPMIVRARQAVRGAQDSAAVAA